MQLYILGQDEGSSKVDLIDKDFKIGKIIAYQIIVI